ncbi:hypothetical protein ACES2I_07015 [Bdellovibrio bacteriovorus]|uniref:hypothetical protein n=1 Tax=Bdellovibrio bacteriovorus TaxID=959 RepID=UPI0035A6790E
MTVKAPRNKFYLSLMPWLLCGFMTFIVACQPSDHTSTGPTETSGGGGNTGDGGGGTGFNSKMYEQYITKLETLHIWKTEIRKVLERTSSFNPALLNVLQKKTWIFVPQKLNRIDAEKMGMEFRAKDYEQYAFQTEGEIWIDSTAFNSLSPETQAYLIFHETVMELYVQSKARGMTVKPKSLYSVLTAADYPKIREATHLLMNSDSGKTSDEMLVHLIGLGFDESVIGSALRFGPAEDNGAKDLKNLISWVENKSIEENCAAQDNENTFRQNEKCLLTLSTDKKVITIKNSDSSFAFELPADENLLGLQTSHLVTKESTIHFSYWVRESEDQNGMTAISPREILISYSGTGQPLSVKFEANNGFTPKKVWIFSKIFSLAPGIGFEF